MKPGWWNPRPTSAGSKWHYIDADGRSLCKKWLYLGGAVEQGMDVSIDNCRPCQRARAIQNGSAPMHDHHQEKR